MSAPPKYWLVAEVLSHGQRGMDSYIHFAVVAQGESEAELDELVAELCRQCGAGEGPLEVVTDSDEEIVYLFHIIKQEDTDHDHLFAWYSDGSISKMATGTLEGEKLPSLDLFEEMGSACGGYAYGGAHVARVDGEIVGTIPLKPGELNGLEFPGIDDHLHVLLGAAP